MLMTKAEMSGTNEKAIKPIIWGKIKKYPHNASDVLLFKVVLLSGNRSGEGAAPELPAGCVFISSHRSSPELDQLLPLL
jgi:hypothetical protein